MIAEQAAGTSPRVSVVMPVLDGMPFVEQAVRSILAQTFTDFRFIIINDGSTDGTRQVLDGLADADPRIHLSHQENQGVSIATNRGLHMARGEYVALMDADDISLPERFEKQVAFLDENPQIGVVGTQVQFVDSQGVPSEATWPLPESPGLTAWRTLFRCCIANPSVMMRRSTLLEVGGYRAVCNSYSQDYDLWTRLVRKTGLTNLSDTLLQFRRHGKNLTLTEADRQERVAIDSTFSLHKKYIGTRADRQVAQFLSRQEHASARWSCQHNSFTAEDLRLVPDYLEALLHSFLAYHDLSAQDGKGVKKDASDKLRDLSRVVGQKDSRLREWRLKMRGHRLAPHHIPKWIIDGIRQRLH